MSDRRHLQIDEISNRGVKLQALPHFLQIDQRLKTIQQKHALNGPRRQTIATFKCTNP